MVGRLERGKMIFSEAEEECSILRASFDDWRVGCREENALLRVTRKITVFSFCFDTLETGAIKLARERKRCKLLINKYSQNHDVFFLYKGHDRYLGLTIKNFVITRN